MSTPRTRHDELLSSLRTTQRSLERYGRSHGAMVAELRQLRAELIAWEQRVRALEASLPLRAVTRLRALADELLPQGTVRRTLARLAVRTARELARRRARTRRPPAPAGAPLAPGVPVVPMALTPDVSIVIPVHDGWALTAACLRSIAEDRSPVDYEVIVVDDASSDETPVALGQVVGVRAVRLDDNLGFVGAVNVGIAQARGRFVVLLNNDTVVEAGWLESLVSTAEADSRIGVVGAKLVYPDGRLQEAGGVIWDDASGHNYGRDQDPADPRFSFVRDVDYCSGACLLVRRELLTLTGGLDTRFAPAYYEDTDLCFAARQHGYRVVYQPGAVVQHHEGASHGTDVESGVKRHQVVNQATFARKWEAVLAAHGRPDHEHVRAASRRSVSGHCLVLDHALPMPDHDSGSRRMSELLGILGDLGFAVAFCPHNGIDIPSYREALCARGIEVLGSPADLDAYFSGIGPELRLVVASRPSVAWANYPQIRALAPDALLVYDTVDLHHVRERRRAITESDPTAATRSADFHYGMEISLAHLVDQVWVVSDPEADALWKIDPSLDIAVVPNIHRPEPPGPGFSGREGLLFVGNYAHDPNRDAVAWLAEEILPLVRAELGDIPVHLAGSQMTPEVAALAAEGLVVHGWVPQLDDLYHRTKLFVAPLRFGAGMKGKIGEACAFGVPVITTPVGAEGMGFVDGEDVLICTDAASFAAAVVEAYRDRELWLRLASGGRAAVQRRLSPERVRADLAQALKKAGLPLVEPN